MVRTLAGFRLAYQVPEDSRQLRHGTFQPKMSRKHILMKFSVGIRAF
jgi:hypothetical protein